MASNGLSELISVTNSVMKSLSSGSTSSAQDKIKSRDSTKDAAKNMDLDYAGSPFESPRSHGSHSDSGMGKKGKTKASEPSFPRGIDSKINEKLTHYDKSKDSTSNEAKRVNSAEDKVSVDVNDTIKTTEGQGKYISAKRVDQNESGEEPQIIDVQAKTIEITMSSGMGEEALDDTQESGGTLYQSGQFFPEKVFYGKVRKCFVDLCEIFRIIALLFFSIWMSKKYQLLLLILQFFSS